MNEFRAARWLPGRHLQTMFGALLRRSVRLPLRRERWELADGDFIDLDLLPSPSGADAGAPLLLALHGLEGSSKASYVRGMLAQASARGWSAAALNFRSCSGEMNRLPRSYHSGETRDLDAVVRRILLRFPGAPLLLCGFSLGGNVLVKWLGEEGEAVPDAVRAAAAISTPFDLALCARSLDGRGMARVYRARFLRTLKRKAKAKARRFPGSLDVKRLRAARTLGDFDEHVTAPLHGFRGAAEYYDRSSSAAFLSRVRVPLLLLAAEDDPFIPPAALPVEDATSNPRIVLEVTRQGGHVGFVAGPPWRPRYFAEERAARFLGEHL